MTDWKNIIDDPSRQYKDLSGEQAEEFVKATLDEYKSLGKEDRDKKKTLGKFLLSVAELKEIRQDASQELMELVVEKEAVHDFANGVAELKSTRLAENDTSDKRSFALEIAGEVQAVVYVSLSKEQSNEDGSVDNKELARNVRRILNAPVQDIEEPNTAIFYTITNVGKVSGSGDTLIKKVVGALSGNDKADGIDEIDTLTTFSTLSPIRSFRKWLDPILEAEANGQVEESIFTNKEQQRIEEIVEGFGIEFTNAAAGLQYLLENQNIDHTPRDREIVNDLLKDLTAEFLLTAKNSRTPPGMQAPVGNFHSSSAADGKGGAYIAKINVEANNTEQEWNEAASVMVNYRYSPIENAGLRAEKYKQGVITAAQDIIDRFNERMIERGEDQGISSENSEQTPSQMLNIRAPLPETARIKAISTDTGISI